MTVDDKAVDMMVSKIISAIDLRSKKNNKYDKTFKSTVWKVNDDNTYQISYMGQLYNVPSAIGALSLGEPVYVVIPSGIFRNMFIYGSKQKSYISNEELNNIVIELNRTVNNHTSEIQTINEKIDNIEITSGIQLTDDVTYESLEV